MVQEHKTPRITIMGEEVPYEEVPGSGEVTWADRFNAVRLTPRAINEASKIVPIELWHKFGIYRWLQGRANHVAKNMGIGETSGRLGLMKYVFEFDGDTPVLKDVLLG
jgi:hypothetical protein